VLRRHPAALASVARYYSRACVEGAREGYRTARVELGVSLPPHAVDGVLAAYKTEGSSSPPSHARSIWSSGLSAAKSSPLGCSTEHAASASYGTAELAAQGIRLRMADPKDSH
jgi:hypothetical protein